MEEQKQNSEITTSEVKQAEVKPRRKRPRFTEALKRLGMKIYDVFREYPVTMGAIILAAFIGALMAGPIDYDTAAYDVCEKIIAFCLILSFQTLFCEEQFRQKLPVRIIGSVLGSLFSLFCVFVFFTKAEFLFGIEIDTVCEILLRFLAVYGSALTGFSILHMFRRLEEDFEIYATRAFLEFLKASVVYGLFALGLALIILIFNELIFDTDDLLEMVEIFLAGGIYTPMCLKAISGKNDEPGKFARFCILYVLQPMLLLAFAIIYLYIVKIFVTNDVPSNRVFPILAYLFSIGMPIWTMVHGVHAEKEKDGSLLQRLTAFVPYLFIPFVLLQCWCLGIRIASYGITLPRYMGIVLIICECIYFALYVLRHRGRKQAISYILPALIAVAAFCILIPGTSYDDVVIHSQMQHLKSEVEANPNPEKDVQRSIKSSYNAIRNVSFKGEKALDKNFTQSQLDLIDSYSLYGDRSDNMIYLNDSFSLSGLDISEYSYLYKFRFNENALKSSTVTVWVYDNDNNKSNISYDVDLSSLLDWAMTEFAKPSRNSAPFTIEDHYRYPVNDRMDLYIEQISLRFDSNKKEVDYLSFSGLLLAK